jgi:glycosyltransferase involved in cell wall biosynthesis
MKVTFVTPRYGTEVLGGAENAARMLAERVHSQLGWEVRALTSCAKDASTWADAYVPGPEDVNGVAVERFAVTGPRHPDFLQTSARVMARGRLVRPEDEERWIDQQGPTAPGILDAIEADDADAFVFYPYLYYPTVRGLPLVARRSVLHPAAHDEGPIRMPIFAKVFSQAAGLVFQTEGERRLTERLFSVGNHPQLLLGLGVSPIEGDEAGFRSAHGLEDRPYILCVGRVDEGKGAFLLAKYFVEYKRRHPGPLAVVFVGPDVQQLPKHDDVIVTGPVSEEHKWGALRGCEVLVQPSPFEAFSLALLEGWAAGKPTMVNAACLATREHAEACHGGIPFDGFGTFEAGLHRLLHDGGLASKMATAGKRYVDARFRWPDLIERYGRFLEDVAERADRKAA